MSLTSPGTPAHTTGRGRSETLARSSSLALLMVLAVVVVAVVFLWDARRESDAALKDFAAEQSTLARGVAAVVAGRLRLAERTGVADTASLLADAGTLEQDGSLRLLLARPDQDGLSTPDGSVVRSASIEDALVTGRQWVRIERTEAPKFRLPERTAVAGLSTFQGPRGRYGVVVVATASKERDREVRAQFRSVLAVLFAAALVLSFGGIAMRNQRQELTLARELAVAGLRREREAQLVQIDKLATLAALATGIAHEVSTPLGVIVGRAEQLLPKVSDDPRARKGVESIIEQGTRIGRVIRGFLDLVRGRSPALETVSPRLIAETAAELVQHRFDGASVRLEVSVADGLPDVSCDPRLLEQAVINLLMNACDACTTDCTVRLGVEATPDHVRFVVTDDGSGITEEAAARATEPFFTTKPAGKGTGLGLAIASEIVKHYGGTLGLEPRRTDAAGPRGTRATIEFPTTRKASS